MLGSSAIQVGGSVTQAGICVRTWASKSEKTPRSLRLPGMESPAGADKALPEVNSMAQTNVSGRARIAAGMLPMKFQDVRGRDVFTWRNEVSL